MRAGYALAPRKETKPLPEEMDLIRAAIRDCHVTTIAEWLVNQKPKLRKRFIMFLDSVVDAPAPPSFSQQCRDLSERFARDITQPKYHPVLRSVLDSGAGIFNDVLNVLSLHMQRSNVMASVPSKRDEETPKLYRAINQEDHILQHPKVTRHEVPKARGARSRAMEMSDDEAMLAAPAKSCKPPIERTSPFAMFPAGEKMESTSHAQFVNPDVHERTQKSGIVAVLNSPTCL